jgi:hypothetical protein
VVPLGYRVEDRALHIVEDHAAIVRSLFRRYLEAGSVVRLKRQLDAEGFRPIVRVPAGVVEALVADAIGKLSSNGAASQTDIRDLIERVVIGRSTIQIRLSEASEAEGAAGPLIEKARLSVRSE